MLIWLAAAAVIGLFCLGMCMAGRMKKRTAVLVVLLGFYLAVIFTFTLGHRVPGRGYDYNLKLFWTIEMLLFPLHNFRFGKQLVFCIGTNGVEFISAHQIINVLP